MTDLPLLFVQPPLHKEPTVRGLQLWCRVLTTLTDQRGFLGWGSTSETSPPLSADSSKEPTVLSQHLTSSNVEPVPEQKNVARLQRCNIRRQRERRKRSREDGLEQWNQISEVTESL